METNLETQSWFVQGWPYLTTVIQQEPLKSQTWRCSSVSLEHHSKMGRGGKEKMFLQYSKFQWAVMPCWLPALHLPLGRVWLGVEGGGAGGQICSMTAPWGRGLIGCTHRVVSSMSALPWFLFKLPSLQNNQIFQDLRMQPNKLEVWFQNTLSFLRTVYIYIMSVNQAMGPRS